MKLNITKSGNYVSGIETQKSIIDYLHNEFSVSKKYVLDFIKQTRENNYLWDSFKSGNAEITIYVVKNHMFIGIKK